ncbi:MAG: metallophosphoesterase family protein [Candidatus Acidiferrum sp.]
MRILAIGDIHGCARALGTLLAVSKPRPDDLIISLGDYVDRGPDSRGVLDQMVILQSTGRLVPLRGNHDLMMLHAREWDHASALWLGCGGKQTLSSYGASDSRPDDLLLIPEAHWNFLENHCVNYHETDSHLFVHASVRPEWPLADQLTDVLLWEKLDGPVAHCSGKTLVCGHTKQTAGVPLNYGTTICIDTGAYAEGGWLTCLDVLDGCYWQANEDGEVRAGWLEKKTPSDFR